MPYRFTDPSSYPYRPGSLFLGLDPATGREVGMPFESHAITVARARTGKGAAVLIPNARRWPHSLVGIDPKGENVEASWQEREALGQTVIAIDPMRTADIPDRLRGGFNPLAAIDPDAMTAIEDIAVLADGMVRRTNPKNAEWDNGACTIIAGVMAHVILNNPPERRTLAAVRALLNEPNEIEDETGELVGGLNHTAQLMIAAEQRGIGKSARQAGVIIEKAITTTTGLPPQLLDAAQRHTAWLDSEPIAAALSSSSFQLTDLTNGKTSVFLVLPADYIKTHAAFLRLFVRTAISVMARAGAIRAKLPASEKEKRRCLFLLDEFYQLGKMDEIQSSSGLMPGYGVHLWPFVQDLGQLVELYTEAGSKTFFANADVHMFFGIDQDPDAARMVSARIGPMAPNEVATGAPAATKFEERFWTMKDEQEQREEWRLNDENAMRGHGYRMAHVGQPRVSPEEIAAMTGKGQSDQLARSMIVFGGGGVTLRLILAPYFQRPAASMLDHTADALIAASNYLPAPVRYYWFHGLWRHDTKVMNLSDF
jgi:type IV secretory pathway TraG/TraD family ATPase VirD4